jgi:hypothetical protein
MPSIGLIIVVSNQYFYSRYHTNLVCCTSHIIYVFSSVRAHFHYFFALFVSFTGSPYFWILEPDPSTIMARHPLTQAVSLLWLPTTDLRQKLGHLFSDHRSNIQERSVKLPVP